MSNPPPTLCLECEAPLNAAETQGLCARCLLKLGFASQFGEPSVGAAGLRVAVPPPLLPFDFGGYRVLHLLGRGGMGAVYEAEHLETGRRVALKVLGQSIDSEEARKRFLREGRLAASVSHPNSIYIYGTEEIEGAPVIAMELAAGGTLRDLIKRRGPLPPREAVDIILQVIAGLENAQEAGVLHRDVKPANCFVTPEGTVKVGDYGLSVSTLARGDSQLTASGVMLGTPSYAPPEQLRADELDVRADIYSVGATLHALLTGNPPFEGENAVQVVAAVLDRQPAMISALRSDVPPALAQVVLHCLQKRREDRYATYAELKEALYPLSTGAAEAASPGMRFVAGVIDESVTFLPYAAYFLLTGNDLANQWLTYRNPGLLLLVLSYFAARVAYYAITEGVWGAGLGKWLCGLQVVRPGAGVPGMACAAMRAVYFSGSELLGYVVQYLILSGPAYTARLEANEWTVADIAWVLFLLLFVTMRKKNGYAAVQDLATGTRVIVKARSAVRPRLAVTPVVRERGEKRMGPYSIIGELAGARWLTGYDELLRRTIWIRLAAAGDSPIESNRRNVSRSGRLRWLGGVRNSETGWDAFESLHGHALTQLPPRSKRWTTVRYWLSDLLQEIDAAQEDGTLPSNLTLDHVWVTNDGRAVLLDEPLTASDHSTPFPVANVVGLQRFLDAVAIYATDQTGLALHARDFLTRLAAAAFDRASFIAGNLQSLLAKPTEVTRRRRLAGLLLAPAIGLLACGGIAIGAYRAYRTGEVAFRRDWPEQRQLVDAVRFYAQVANKPLVSTEWITPVDVKDAPMAELIGKWTSYRYGEFIRDPQFEQKAGALSKVERDLARTMAAEYPNVTKEEFDGMNSTVSTAINEMDRLAKIAILGIGPGMFGVLLVFIMLVNLVSVTFFGTSLGLRIFGFCVVDANGKLAPRWRHLLRNLLPCAILPGAVIFVVFSHVAPNAPVVAVLAMLIAIGAGLLSACCFVTAIIWPSRSIYDRIAGTTVVLR